MNGILGLLADAEKLTPDQRAQSVKNGVLPPDLANMLGMAEKDLNQTQPKPQEGQSSISDQVMGQVDKALDPRNEILEKIDVLKDDIGKIQGAIQSGEVKPYVGLPLLANKVEELNKLESIIKPPQMPENLQQPVNANMQPGMQPAQEPQSLNGQQMDAQGLNTLQSNLPQQMAYGGIVNLASGSHIDAEDEDDEDEQRAFEQQMMNMPMGEGLGAAIMGASKKSSQPVNKGVEQASNQNNSSVTKKIGQTAKEFYRTMYSDIKSTAEKMGISNPEAIAHLGASQSAIETGYGKHAPNNNFFGIKGAGSKQVTQEYVPGKGMVTITDTFRGYESPQESIKDYINFLQKNSRYKPVLEAKTPQEAIIAQSKTGYATDPKYGSKLNSIYSSNMAEGGIVGLAHGGKIKHFYTGNKIADEDMREINDIGSQLDTARTAVQGLESFGSRQRQLIPDYQTKYDDALKQRQALQKKYETLMSKTGVDKPAIGYQTNLTGTTLTPTAIGQAMAPKEILKTPPVPTTPTKPVTDLNNQNPYDTEDFIYGQRMRDMENNKGDELAQAEKPRSSMDDFLDYIKKSRDDIKRSHETDKYMGLLMAGLGTLGGTSQYGAANIGKGAGMGVQHYADLQRQQAAERANLDKLQLYGNRAQMTDALYREMRETPDERKARLDRLVAKDKQEAEDRGSNLQEKTLLRYERAKDARDKMFENHLLKTYPLAAYGDKDSLAKIAKEREAYEKNPQTIFYNKKLYGDDIFSGIPSAESGFKILPPK
jgi:hypothetical protein